MTRTGISLLVVTGALAAAPPPLLPQDGPFPPHRVVGNVHYVGSKTTAVFLVTTPQGHILVNSGFAETVPLVRASVEQLGFRFADIRILLASHAHGDHVGGHAEVRRLTGARVLVMAGDDNAVRTGGRGGVESGREWEPSPVDEVLADGDTVTLGGTTLVAHHTPGHTPGTTTWTLAVEDGGRRYDVVIVGGGAPEPDDRLVDNPTYPGIADDYRKTIRVLRSLACDVPLGAHGSYYRLERKYAALEADSTRNPFVDPDWFRMGVEMLERRFTELLAAQQQRRTP